MRFYQSVYLFICMLLLGCSAVHAAGLTESEGIALESTRVIYPGSAKNGITFTVTNRTSQLYLLQSRVLPWNVLSASAERDNAEVLVDDSVPFIVLPPLTRFAPEDAMTLRLRLTKNNLPKDQESVFTLALKAIPAQSAPDSSSDESGAKMVLALQNNLKLFYRPEGLAVMNGEERAKQLRFSCQGKTLTVDNPTPYYVTFSEVLVDVKPVLLRNHRMIPPFSTTSYEGAENCGKTVSWQIIDDDGNNPPIQTQPLS